MRADRLLSVLMFLQNRGRTTTDRLAEELEVSRRTIIRDLYALRVAGFPVYTERGPHGGVYLHEDFRMRLTDLTQGELAALFTFSVPAPLADLGMGGTAKGALLKLAAALPQARQDVERDVRSRLYLDPNPWHASREAIPTLSTLRQAVWEDRWVRATLLRVRQIPIEHEIAPYGLVAKGRAWYVVWRRRDGELRVDLASDVIEAELMSQTFDRPPGFHLGEFWTAWAAAYEANRWFFPVTVRATEEVLPELERALGRHIRRTADAERGSSVIDVEMAFDGFGHARAALLAHGGAVEVIEPDALRLSIADFAQRIVEVYEPRLSVASR
jgi:predicted DNA-binding transcriptional regulator YafY